jgi:hypothetical protein
MLNPFEAILALQKLVLLHHKPRTSDELGPFIVCFDEAGVELDTDEVSAAHPKEMVGQLETWTPTPGTGYYAHIRQSSSNANRHTGVVTRWEVEGPDWAAFVDVFEPLNQSISATVNITSLTAGALSFLERYRAR